jgi:hypothetical protein
MKEPGRKRTSGLKCPDNNKLDCVPAAATAIDAAIKIMTSTETRLPILLEIIDPVTNPTGTIEKYKPNSVAGRCRASFMSIEEAVATTMNVPVLQAV